MFVSKVGIGACCVWGNIMPVFSLKTGNCLAGWFDAVDERVFKATG
jgi:hypothetical protein